MFLDKLSLFSGLWPVFLALFLLVYAAFVLMKEFVVWCFEYSKKRKAITELREMIGKKHFDKDRFVLLAGIAGWKVSFEKSIIFDESNIKDWMKSIELKNGDVLVYGTKGMTHQKYNNITGLICPFLPDGCALFTDFDSFGFRKVNRGELLRSPLRDSPTAPSLST